MCNLWRRQLRGKELSCPVNGTSPTWLFFKNIYQRHILEIQPADVLLNSTGHIAAMLSRPEMFYIFGRKATTYPRLMLIQVQGVATNTSLIASWSSIKHEKYVTVRHVLYIYYAENVLNVIFILGDFATAPEQARMIARCNLWWHVLNCEKSQPGVFICA